MTRWKTSRTALGRGWRKRCPHCGRGRIFSGWAHHLDRCAECGLVYERNPGDTWAFTIIGDRLPVAVLIMVVYFGLFRSHRTLGIIAFAVIGLLFFWTSPNRWGVGIALHYLSRLFWPDPADPVPDLPQPGGEKTPEEH
jgi:ribosomal protein S27AE